MKKELFSDKKNSLLIIIVHKSTIFTGWISPHYRNNEKGPAISLSYSQPNYPNIPECKTMSGTLIMPLTSTNTRMSYIMSSVVFRPISTHSDSFSCTSLPTSTHPARDKRSLYRHVPLPAQNTASAIREASYPTPFPDTCRIRPVCTLRILFVCIGYLFPMQTNRILQMAENWHPYASLLLLKNRKSAGRNSPFGYLSGYSFTFTFFRMIWGLRKFSWGQKHL